MVKNVLNLIVKLFLLKNVLLQFGQITLQKYNLMENKELKNGHNIPYFTNIKPSFGLHSFKF